MIAQDQPASYFVEGIATSADRKRVEEERRNIRGVVFYPWSRNYKIWWGITVFGAISTIFTETYKISFEPAGLSTSDGSAIVEYVLISVFLVDIIVNFHLAYYDEQDANDVIVYDRKRIAKHYLRSMFWIDVLGVFPFYVLLLACTGQLGQDSRLAQYLNLVRLVRLVRLHRMKQLFDILQFNTHVSLIWLTILRNIAAALVWTHFSACVMYFIARQLNFDGDTTWIGGSFSDMQGFERYLTSLYWSVVTFTTVGYGDFSPVHWAEQIWGMIYMLLNIILHSWIIGSMTLLIVKTDEKTKEYRESLEVLHHYSLMHGFDRPLEKSLQTQLKLEFNNREISDEQVLKYLPRAVRRKVLRRLYLPSLIQTSLMKGIRQQFVDAFLATCTVEIFSSGEEVLQRGSISSDLYLLVGGVVELLPLVNNAIEAQDLRGYGTSNTASNTDSESRTEHAGAARELDSGEFINEIGFFTESPQIDTVRTKTICKILTMSRSAYKMIAEDHPGSVGKILQNLLAKVEAIAEECGSTPHVHLTKEMEILRAGSTFDISKDTSHNRDVQRTVSSVQTGAALTATQDLVKMHMNKQKDDHTTRFLFAASRGDISTITLMCDQGFDPNSADYDCRTGLMVASMKGNTEAVAKMLDYHADPNLADMNRSSALYDATKNGHEDTMDVLLKHGAELGMDDGQAASTLRKAVFDGDISMLRRLLRARIHVNACDYDKRTAAHVAASEGSVAALKVLVEFGADLTLADRWNNTVDDEANRSNASSQLLEYLKVLQITGT